MKEKIKLEANHTKEGNATVLDHGTPPTDQYLENDAELPPCTNTTQTTCSNENQKDQKIAELVASDHNYSMSSLLNFPLSKAGNESVNSGMSAHAGFSPMSQLVPGIGLESLGSSSVHHGFLPVSQHLPADFSGKFAELLQQRAQSEFYQHSFAQYLPHQFFNMKDGQSLDISTANLKSENNKEPINSRISEESEEITVPSPGELVEEVQSEEKARKRKRLGDEPAKTALQRKMEHLDREKERRLRQTKCYEYLRNLVPFQSEEKTDKANVLEVTVAYLTHIRKTLGSRMAVIDKSFLEDVKRKVSGV